MDINTEEIKKTLLEKTESVKKTLEEKAGRKLPWKMIAAALAGVVLVVGVAANVGGGGNPSSYLRIEGTVVTGMSNPEKVPAHVKIPEGITEIEENAFTVREGRYRTGSRAVKTLSLPKSLKKIGSQAFYDCTYLESVEIPGSVTEIGSYAFNGCTSLASVKIPNGVTYISGDAFKNCTSLASVNIPDGVTGIGYNAFDGCTSLKSVTIPGSVEEIYRSAFGGCTSLASVEISEGVKKIGQSAFQDCTSLASVVIPSSVTSIWARAFQKCPKLKDVRYEGTVKQWEPIIDSGFRRSSVWDNVFDADTGVVIHCTDGDVVW